MVEQGPNRTFTDLWQYGSSGQQHLGGLSQLVLSSASPIIVIAEVARLKLEWEVTRTTQSGILTNIKI